MVYEITDVPTVRPDTRLMPPLSVVMDATSGLLLFQVPPRPVSER
jgi:hypothetical protein